MSEKDTLDNMSSEELNRAFYEGASRGMAKFKKAKATPHCEDCIVGYEIEYGELFPIHNKHFLLNVEYYRIHDYDKFNYCPMCGSKL